MVYRCVTVCISFESTLEAPGRPECSCSFLQQACSSPAMRLNNHRCHGLQVYLRHYWKHLSTAWNGPSSSQTVHTMILLLWCLCAKWSPGGSFDQASKRLPGSLSVCNALSCSQNEQNATEILQNEALLRLLKLALVALEAACLQQTERQWKTPLSAGPYGPVWTHTTQVKARITTMICCLLPLQIATTRAPSWQLAELASVELGLLGATLEIINSNKHWAQTQYWKYKHLEKKHFHFQSKLSAVLQFCRDSGKLHAV